MLALLTEQRRLNASAQPVVEARLPDLTPELLMSGAAIREMQAASGQYSSPILPRQPAPDAVRGRFEHVAMIDDSQSFGSEPDLEAMFLARAMAETGMAAPTVTSSEDDFYGGFSFETDDDIPGRAEPNPSARFQIGRQDPPRMAFFHDTPSPGGSDGSVVSRRGADGTWQTSRASRPAPTMSRAAAVAAAPAPRAPSPPPATRSPAQPQMTFFQHLMLDD